MKRTEAPGSASSHSRPAKESRRAASGAGSSVFNRASLESFVHPLRPSKPIRRQEGDEVRFLRSDLRTLVTREGCLFEKRSDEIGVAYEDAGDLTFTLVHNDGDVKALFALVCLKNVFSRQLPNMPREYIWRLVGDPRHYSLVALWKGSVIGGITFRPFYTPKVNFGEIAFCAVFNHQDTEQRGVGARLMQNLKIEALKMGIDNFLTYADDTAIGFFAKMGFSKKIGLPHDTWRGFIKDYERATLMHCSFRRDFDYSSVADIVHLQRQAILSLFPKLSTASQLRTVLRVAEPEVSSSDRVLQELYDAVFKHEDAWPFKQSIQEIIDSYPAYRDTIKNPLDLYIISERMQKSFYRTYQMFIADVVVMLKNCQRFNGDGSEYSRYASKVLDSFKIACTSRGKDKEFDSVFEGFRYIFDPDQVKKNKKK
eukprot:ANDGO_00414.mRNA.1 Histone acetyltransferase GCN5